MINRYNSLVERIDDLHFRFVPSISPTGQYTDAEYDQMRAFRLLAHAEIESFFEFLTEDALSRMIKTIQFWRAAGTSSNLVDQVVAYTDRNLRSELVKKNNGVKSSNILSLLKPLGITGAQLDNIWLQTMNSYVEVRGGFAHSTQRTTQLLDPLTEQDLIYKQILPELNKLEVLVNSVI